MVHLPRFERSHGGAKIVLTERDRRILREVARYRFLNSRQVVALVGGSEQHVLRRLQRLFHAGFLDRPKAQIRYFSEAGSLPYVYGLGRKGVRALGSRAFRLRYDNQKAKQLYLEHTLMVADVMIAVTKACQSPGAPRLYLEEDLAPDESTATAFSWGVTVRRGSESRRVGVVPDRTFALEGPRSGRILYFVEADRATMPVERRSLVQSSMLRKFLAYEATWEQRIAPRRFRCERFRVLVVTPSPERAHHLAEVANSLPRGRGLFLFADIDALKGRVFPETGDNILSIPWLNGAGGTERLSQSVA